MPSLHYSAVYSSNPPSLAQLWKQVLLSVQYHVLCMFHCSLQFTGCANSHFSLSKQLVFILQGRVYSYDLISLWCFIFWQKKTNNQNLKNHILPNTSYINKGSDYTFGWWSECDIYIVRQWTIFLIQLVIICLNQWNFYFSRIGFGIFTLE